ncbi:hypothetical protein V6N13_048341 [Hibiscus sabdariffa]
MHQSSSATTFAINASPNIISLMMITVLALADSENLRVSQTERRGKELRCRGYYGWVLTCLVGLLAEMEVAKLGIGFGRNVGWGLKWGTLQLMWGLVW